MWLRLWWAASAFCNAVYYLSWGFIPLAIAVIYAIIGIFLFAGLKVLKPEEALVLTLFGDYIGTLKGGGLLLGQSLLHCRQPGCGHGPEPER